MKIHKCPKCKTKCGGRARDIARTFGYRLMKRVTAAGVMVTNLARQSYCRSCRNAT